MHSNSEKTLLPSTSSCTSHAHSISTSTSHSATVMGQGSLAKNDVRSSPPHHKHGKCSAREARVFSSPSPHTHTHTLSLSLMERRRRRNVEEKEEEGEEGSGEFFSSRSLTVLGEVQGNLWSVEDATSLNSREPKKEEMCAFVGQECMRTTTHPTTQPPHAPTQKNTRQPTPQLQLRTCKATSSESRPHNHLLFKWLKQVENKTTKAHQHHTINPK